MNLSDTSLVPETSDATMMPWRQNQRIQLTRFYAALVVEHTLLTLPTL